MALDWRELPSIIAPPDRPEAYDDWLAELRQAEADCRRDLKLDTAAVSRPELAWAKRCFVCAKWMTWDRRFMNSTTGELKPRAFLDDARRRFGAYDGVVLWQAYPRIGFDRRNQFDFYRDLAGGLSRLKETVAELKKAGVRVFVAYNPWDVGTRREAGSDGEALRHVVDAIGADGVFLDTLRSGDSSLSKSLLETGTPMGLESELDLPPTALAEHALSWMQWPNPPDLLGVLRNTWLSRGHMQHVIRRWHKSHRHELALAWLNGAGMLVWENIFASWNGWRADDAVLVRAMRDFYRAAIDVFAQGERRPLVPMSNPYVKISEWRLGSTSIWTIANASAEAQSVQLPEGAIVVFGATLDNQAATLAPHSLAAAVRGSRLSVALAKPPEMPKPVIRRMAAPVVRKPSVPFGMAEVRYEGGTFRQRVRVRECGDYRYADFEDHAYPGLHQIVTVERDLPPSRFAVDVEEVTNAQFAEFLAATSYKPKNSEFLLRHWQNGRPKEGTEHQPVVYVNLPDARAYAQWKGKRLPTEWEWQLAMAQGLISRGTPLVWNWTECEHTDGINDFAMLKGGCETKVVGSDWYGDGGHQEPEFVAKLLLVSPGIDRAETIGFRCAIDLAG